MGMVRSNSIMTTTVARANARVSRMRARLSTPGPASILSLCTPKTGSAEWVASLEPGVHALGSFARGRSIDRPRRFVEQLRRHVDAVNGVPAGEDASRC